MPSPHALKLKRHTKAGSLEDARLLLWRAMQAAQEAMYRAGEVGDRGGVLSAVHAVTQACGAYGRLLESAELRGEVDALRAEVEELRKATASAGGLRKVA